MSEQAKSHRIGDMLVERGIITRQQLCEAIEIQQARQLLREGTGKTSVEPLGEILIELGFIDRGQLTHTLSWQRRLRNATLIMSFVAPLLTTACGGGGGAGTTSPSGSNKTPPNSSLTSSVASDSVSSSPDASIPAPSSSSAISFSSDSSLSPLSSNTSSSQSNSEINGPVLLSWAVPSARENGDYLGVEEVGGYEIRYREKGAENFSSVRITGGYVNNHYFSHLQGNLEFEIAAYDTNGLFSRFIAILPQKNTSG
ncbi:hypothetical protein [Cellvibrio fontiphilus]|uniref:Fibronectin type-III domain-containing protein n=1 Tax=Cellvibrio fontiphilus TaxID=1815559 RepID=A0ABV7FFJ7_9GAMM